MKDTMGSFRARALGVSAASVFVATHAFGAGLNAGSFFAETSGTAGDISDRFTWENDGVSLALTGDTDFMTHDEFGDLLSITGDGTMKGPVVPGDKLVVSYDIFVDYNFGSMDLEAFYIGANGVSEERGEGKFEIFGEADESGNPIPSFTTLTGTFETSVFEDSYAFANLELGLDFGFTPENPPLRTEFFVRVEVRNIHVRRIPAPSAWALAGLGAITMIRRRR